MQLLDWIVCDDIRMEIGGKHTLVGVYDNLEFHKAPEKWPINIKLSFFIRIKRLDDDMRPDRFVVEFTQDGNQSGKFDEKMGVKGSEYNLISICMVNNAFPILGPGKLNMKISFYEGERLMKAIESPYGLEIKIKK